MESNAVRARERRERERLKGIIQINIRVPQVYDVSLKLLATDLCKGMRLEGFVLRDPTTGQLCTRIL